MPNKQSDARKLPQQQRSKQIVEAIVEASRKILLEEGAEHLNTNHVAEVAGVNIASLYRWFPNKEAIIQSTFEALVEEEIKDLLTMHASLHFEEPVSINDAITYIIDPLIQRQCRFLSLHETFYRENQSDFDVGKRPCLDTDESWMDAANSWIATVIQSNIPNLSFEEAELKAFMLSRSIQGICFSAATDQPELLQSPEFRDEIFEMARLYLEGKKSTRSLSG